MYTVTCYASVYCGAQSTVYYLPTLPKEKLRYRDWAFISVPCDTWFTAEKLRREFCIMIIELHRCHSCCFEKCAWLFAILVFSLWQKITSPRNNPYQRLHGVSCYVEVAALAHALPFGLCWASVWAQIHKLVGSWFSNLIFLLTCAQYFH